MRDKPKLIFVNPPYEEYAAGKGRRGQIRVYPSLGVSYLISSLETDPDVDCDIKLIDCGADDLGVEGLMERLAAEQPAVVLITVGTFTLRAAKQITDACRKALPSARIVLGGIHFNHSPGEFKHFDAGYALRGDCEFTIRALIKCMLNNDAEGIRNIEGIVYKADGELVVGKPAGIRDLNSIPFPDRTRLDPQKYIYPLFDKKFTTIIGSRGCPYKCVYCGLPNNLSYRKRSVENIVEELKTIVARGYEYVSFSDDLFSLERNRVLDLCAQIHANGLRFEWGCATRADCVDYELLCTMRAAGCRDVRFGIETGVEKLRKKIIGKNITNDQCVASVRDAKRAGLVVVGFFIFGHPSETLEDMRETSRFANSLELDYIGISIGIPIPNSGLCKVALAEGILDERIWEHVLMGQKEIPRYHPPGVSLDAMSQLLSQSMRSFYLRPSYAMRQVRSIRSVQDLVFRIKTGWRLLSSYARR